MRWPGLMATVALTAAAGAAAAVAGRAAAGHAPPPLAVLGFQSEGSPPKLIDRNARSMTIVGVDGVDLTGPGEVSTPDSAARRELTRAHTDGLPAVLLVDNWSNRANDFYEPLAHQTLGSRATTDRATSTLAHDVRAGHWNGVSVDLESLAPRDRAGLTRFVADLRHDLPQADSVTVCVTAFTSPAAYRANGYDLAGLAAGADQIVLMTYDDHGPWEDTPGPIGPLPWQRASVHALAGMVPRRQVFLGVADYGYAWRPHSNDSLSTRQARALSRRWHVQPRWMAGAGEWTARLRDGSVLWWSDARSIRRRITLARALGVHGIAVWSLDGDPIP